MSGCSPFRTKWYQMGIHFHGVGNVSLAWNRFWFFYQWFADPIWNDDRIDFLKEILWQQKVLKHLPKRVLNCLHAWILAASNRIVMLIHPKRTHMENKCDWKKRCVTFYDCDPFATNVRRYCSFLVGIPSWFAFRASTRSWVKASPMRNCKRWSRRPDKHRKNMFCVLYM